MAIVRIEISKPAYEVENLRYLTIHSSYLKGRGDVTVYIPKNSEDISDLPVVILLHGVYGSHWAWTRHMNVHNVTQELIDSGKIPPMILVMPSDGLWGGGTAYVPFLGYDFEKWITEDLNEALIQKIPQISMKSPKFISGLSMGGYGALRIGSRYPNLFKAFSGHSSVTKLDQMPLFVNDYMSSSAFQQNQFGGSVFENMLNNKNNLLPFRFDCGKDDLLIKYNKELHQNLKESGINHVYEEFEGDHSFEYWQEHIVKSLVFFSNTLNQIE